MWLADPSAPAPLRLTDVAYGAAFDQGGTRILVEEPTGATLFTRDGAPLGPAFPEAVTSTWRRGP